MLCVALHARFFTRQTAKFKNEPQARGHIDKCLMIIIPYDLQAHLNFPESQIVVGHQQRDTQHVPPIIEGSHIQIRGIRLATRAPRTTTSLIAHTCQPRPIPTTRCTLSPISHRPRRILRYLWDTCSPLCPITTVDSPTDRGPCSTTR